RDLGRGMVIAVTLGLVGLVPPILTKLLFDRVYPTGDVSLLAVLVVSVAASTITASCLGAVKTAFTQLVSAKLTRATSLLFFNHLQHLPTRFFDTHRVGEIT